MTARTTKLAIWLLHAYLMALPLAFLAIFAAMSVYVSHANPAGMLADLALSLVLLAVAGWAAVALGRRLVRGVAGGGFAVFLAWMEVAAAVLVAAWLLWIGEPPALAVAALGLAAATAGAVALVRRPPHPGRETGHSGGSGNDERRTEQR